jgi:hypothetical protein
MEAAFVGDDVKSGRFGLQNGSDSSTIKSDKGCRRFAALSVNKS